jgi:CheY-like chemotaxis protein
MVRILIIDDHAVVREGVEQVVRERRSDAAFGEARTAAEASEMVQQQDWDIVGLDLTLGGRGGLELLKEIKGVRPRLPILVLSMHSGRCVSSLTPRARRRCSAMEVSAVRGEASRLGIRMRAKPVDDRLANSEQRRAKSERPIQRTTKRSS